MSVHPTTRRQAILVLASAVLLGVACGGGGGPSSASVVKRVGPNGGTVSGAGVVLSFPSGAVGSELEVSVARLDDDATAGLAAAMIPGGNTVATMVGAPVEFTPHGAAFNIPVHVDMEVAGQASLIMRLDDRDDPTWEVVPGATIVGGHATFEIAHFSVYAAFHADDAIPEPDACSKAKCGGDEVKACSSAATSGCWKPLEGVRVPAEIGLWSAFYLTQAYGADLDTPGAAPYAVYVSLGEQAQPTDQTVLAFFPLRDGITAADVVKTEPFAVKNGDVPVALTVRALFALPDGFVVTGDAGRPVLLHVSRGTPTTWIAREIRPRFTHALPHEYASWTDLPTQDSFAARSGGNLHVIAAVKVPVQSVAPTMHRWTIPLGGFQTATDGTVTVTALETDDSFELVDDRHLYPLAVGPGPEGTLAISSHGVRVEHVAATDTFVEHYDVRLQLWDVAAGRRVAERSYESASNGTSGETVSGCKTTAVSTTGFGFGHIDARSATLSGGTISNAALMASVDGMLLYVSQNDTGADVLARCARPLQVDGGLGQLVTARFAVGASPAFSGIWTLGNWEGDGGRFLTLSSHDPAGDALDAVEMYVPGSTTGIGILGAASNGDGHRLFAEGRDTGGGRQVYVLDVNGDGKIAPTSAAK